MNHSVLQLHCTAEGCHHGNALDQRLCQACSTPLVHRYLRLLGRSLPNHHVQTLIHQRYWVVHPQWVLDLHPELPPTMPETVPEVLVPYLRLVSHRPHIPQIYGQLPEQAEETWLLEYTPTVWADDPLANPEQLIPPNFEQQWTTADAVQQVNLLWQMARLWEPLAAAGVVSSLLEPELIRVQGMMLQLQELRRDADPIALSALGRSWQSYTTKAHRLIEPFLQGLVQQLQSGAIASATELTQQLDGALANLQGLRQRTYHTVAATDAGPTRDHNEDACYPHADEVIAGSTALAIVCDGIGGHEGGEVASGMAIVALETALPTLVDPPATSSEHILETLAERILAANTQICDQNDQEAREERQRMGTTLVTVLATSDAVYHAHVGDSRLYWLTCQGCYRLTLDDDVATREVRLGYAFERDALSFPGGGSLVQALGMGPRIHPNCDRFIPEEDGVLLLCSDGLSDYDRVEQYWPSEIIPVLTGDRTPEAALQRLVHIANHKNGHDNVTVALVHVQVEARDHTLSPLAPPSLAILPTAKTQVRKRRFSSLWLKAFGVLILLLLGLGALSLVLFPEWREQLDRILGNSTVTPPATAPEPTGEDQNPVPNVAPSTDPGVDSTVNPTVSPTATPTVETLPPTQAPPTTPTPNTATPNPETSSATPPGTTTPSTALSTPTPPSPVALPTLNVGQVVQLPAATLLYRQPQLSGDAIAPSNSLSFEIVTQVTDSTQQSWLKLQGCGESNNLTVWLPEAAAQNTAQVLPVGNCSESPEKLVE